MPPGAQLALRIDMKRVRESPLGPDVTRFLHGVPDWQLILAGSGIDPVADLAEATELGLNANIGMGLGGMGELRYANELVEFIRAETGDHFFIEVAAYPEYHPQAPSPAADLLNFKRKVDAGADSAITQYFYNADAYCHFVDNCEKAGISIPIVPGIMPITNYTQLARFSDATGAEIPRWIRKKLEAFGEDLDSLRAFGEEVVTYLSEKLLDAGAPGLHFYTMNQSGPTLKLWKNLGLERR